MKQTLKKLCEISATGSISFWIGLTYAGKTAANATSESVTPAANVPSELVTPDWVSQLTQIGQYAQVVFVLSLLGWLILDYQEHGLSEQAKEFLKGEYE